MNQRISLTVLGLIVALLSFAQSDQLEALPNQFPDSLVLTTDNKNEITFMFDRMGSNEQYFTSELWKSMINVMETAIERSDEDEGILVTYRTVLMEGTETVRISIAELEEAESVFTIDSDAMQEKLASRIEFLIIQPKVAVSFSVQDREELTEVKEMAIETVWSQIQAKYENQGKNNLYRGNGTIKYGNTTIDQISDFRPRLDQVELTFIGVGLGYYRDRFVPDIGSKITFHMFDRLGRNWIDFGFLYTNQFFYAQDENSNFTLSPNGWLSGFAKIHNVEGNEFGIGIGGLIHSKGDFYEGGTYKISVFNKSVNSRFTFSPEFIFTDDFKDFFPALRFGLSF